MHDKVYWLSVVNHTYDNRRAHKYGSRPLKSTRRHGLFLKSTGDIELPKSAGAYTNKRQGTLPFLNIDRRH